MQIAKVACEAPKIGEISSAVLHLFNARGEHPVYRKPICTHALVLQTQFWHMHMAVSPRLRGCPIPHHGKPPATVERAPLRAPRVNESLADAHGFAGWTTKKSMSWLLPPKDVTLTSSIAGTCRRAETMQ